MYLSISASLPRKVFTAQFRLNTITTFGSTLVLQVQLDLFSYTLHTVLLQDLLRKHIAKLHTRTFITKKESCQKA